MIGRDGADLLIGGVRADAAEEHPDFRLPPLEVGTHYRHFLIVGELAPAERLGALADPELAGAGGTQVAHPLAVAPGRKQVATPVVVEQVDRGRAPLAALAAFDREHARARDAHTVSGQEGDQPVRDVPGEPAGGAVVIGHGHSVPPRRPIWPNAADPQAGRGLADVAAGLADVAAGLAEVAAGLAEVAAG